MKSIGWMVLVCFCCTLSMAQSYRKVPVEPGDRCVITGSPLTVYDSVLIYNGQRVPLRAEVVSQFLNQPDKYLEKLEMPPQRAAHRSVAEFSLIWLLFWIWVGSALAIGMICAAVASQKGHPPWLWFCLGVVGHVGSLWWIIWIHPHKRRAVPPEFDQPPTLAEIVECVKCGLKGEALPQKCAECGASWRAKITGNDPTS
ncbi:MAG: hypothetical protein D6675_12360 [Gemmatimonadetes bacterium]|nr:MAG: hypothetical protein D6675_12360 [Gemmatimonadota bacterium]